MASGCGVPHGDAVSQQTKEKWTGQNKRSVASVFGRTNEAFQTPIHSSCSSDDDDGSQHTAKTETDDRILSDFAWRTANSRELFHGKDRFNCRNEQSDASSCGIRVPLTTAIHNETHQWICKFGANGRIWVSNEHGRNAQNKHISTVS